MFFGLCKGVLAYPRFKASYTVSVRQYRILQSRFLQCILHSKPPCDLLIFRSTTSAYKGLTPSGKIHLLLGCMKKICIFGLFQQLTTSVRCSMQGTHSKACSKRGGRGYLKCVLLYLLLFVRQESASNAPPAVSRNRYKPF